MHSECAIAVPLPNATASDAPALSVAEHAGAVSPLSSYEDRAAAEAQKKEHELPSARA